MRHAALHEPPLVPKADPDDLLATRDTGQRPQDLRLFGEYGSGAGASNPSTRLRHRPVVGPPGTDSDNLGLDWPFSSASSRRWFHAAFRVQSQKPRGFEASLAVQ
jgi:hypothetical protein